jgi:selenocysteine-specific elongation factor
MPRHLVVGTAGHIDHGKSTLIEALTGVHPDRLKEEKARGITIDLGFAHLRDAGRTIAFVDVPGHERFVRNMLAGAGGIDAALLVVAADESVMPQTREHFDICRLLGVRRGLVVLTKADLADDEMQAVVRADVAGLVAGSFLERAPVLPVSARTGAGLDALRAALWRLVDDAAERPSDGAVRLPIDRVFSMRGFGTVITGTLAAGRIAPEDALEAVPGGRSIKVRGVQVHGDQAKEAVAGERTALNLAGVEVGDLARGQVLVEPGTLRPTRLLDAVVEVLPSARPLEHGTRVHFHQGTADVLARVSVVAVPEDEAGNMPAIEPGARGFLRVRLEREVALTRGDRFVLRSYSPMVTMAGGIVLDPDAPRGGVRLGPTLARFTVLSRPLTVADGTTEREAHAVMVAETGGRGLRADALIWKAGVAPADLTTAVRALVDAGQALAVDGWLVAPRWKQEAIARVLTALEAHHGAEPLSEGMPREEVRERILAGMTSALGDHVLEELATSGRIAGSDRLALAGRRAVLSGDDARIGAAIERVLRDAGLAPPDTERLPALVQADAVSVERVLQYLVRRQAVQRLGGMPFHHEALDRLRAEIGALKAPGADAYVDVAAFKARYGLTRKFAIPLLEYLDRERVTRRVGDRRLVL